MTMKINILFSKEKGKVLYLEAGKDFIDLLMALLRMPTANLLKLLIGNKKLSESRIGIFNIFSSAAKLDDSFMKVEKNILLKPSPPDGSSQLQFLGFHDAADPLTRGYYTCPVSDHWFLSRVPGKACTSCGAIMTKKLVPLDGFVDLGSWYTCSKRHKVGAALRAGPDCRGVLSFPLTSVDSGGAAGFCGGFVKDTVTFMVTDDLEFFPSSTIKSLSLLNTLGVKSMADLDSFETTVSKDDALALVQAALTSSSALNDVFGRFAPKRSREDSGSASIKDSDDAQGEDDGNANEEETRSAKVTYKARGKATPSKRGRRGSV